MFIVPYRTVQLIDDYCTVTHQKRRRAVHDIINPYVNREPRLSKTATKRKERPYDLESTPRVKCKKRRTLVLFDSPEIDTPESDTDSDF